MMEEEVKKQLKFVPEIKGQIPEGRKFVVCGMGGSALPARIVNFLDAAIPLKLHNNFDLPKEYEDNALFIAISYSGNTAETISFAKAAIDKNLPLFIITSGGKLGETANNKNITHIMIPSGCQPRDAIIYMLKSLLTVLGREDLLGQIEDAEVDYPSIEKEGKRLAAAFDGKVPLIYSSEENSELAHIWKIIFNETGKIPAFYNVFPELAHNEMQGLVPETAGDVAKDLKIVLLKDAEDDTRIKKEMEIFSGESEEKSMNIEEMNLPSGKINKLLQLWLTARVTAKTMASGRGLDPEKVPFIESFKEEMRR